MKASRRAGSARPSSFLAFFHDRPSRCRAARTLSRQHERANRARTKPTSRLSVQRGFGSAPPSGGPAASRWAAQTAAPSAAWISGQRGDGPPGAVVQLQRLADRANVELTSIKTNTYSDYGSIRGTEFEIRVTGRFFDVDDFLYRLHRQVAVNEKDRPVVGGRLFATTSVDLTLQQDGESNGTSGAPKDDDQVVG